MKGALKSEEKFTGKGPERGFGGALSELLDFKERTAQRQRETKRGLYLNWEERKALMPNGLKMKVNTKPAQKKAEKSHGRKKKGLDESNIRKQWRKRLPFKTLNSPRISN